MEIRVGSSRRVDDPNLVTQVADLDGGAASYAALNPKATPTVEVYSDVGGDATAVKKGLSSAFTSEVRSAVDQSGGNVVTAFTAAAGTFAAVQDAGGEVVKPSTKLGQLVAKDVLGQQLTVAAGDGRVLVGCLTEEDGSKFLVRAFSSEDLSALAPAKQVNKGGQLVNFPSVVADPRGGFFSTWTAAGQKVLVGCELEDDGTPSGDPFVLTKAGDGKATGSGSVVIAHEEGYCLGWFTRQAFSGKQPKSLKQNPDERLRSLGSKPKKKAKSDGVGGVFGPHGTVHVQTYGWDHKPRGPVYNVPNVLDWYGTDQWNLMSDGHGNTILVYHGANDNYIRAMAWDSAGKGIKCSFANDLFYVPVIGTTTVEIDLVRGGAWQSSGQGLMDDEFWVTDLEISL